MSKTNKEPESEKPVLTKVIPVRDRNGITIRYEEVETTEDKLNVFEFKQLA